METESSSPLAEVPESAILSTSERSGAERFPAELKDRQAELSEANRLFLEFVERNPETLQASSFEVLKEKHPWINFPLQPWPIFLSASKTLELQRVSQALAELVADLPQRLFGNEPELLAEHTGLERRDARFFASMLADPSIRAGTLARGDFVLGPDGFRCLEMNMTKPGGLAYSTQAELYRRVPVLSRFLEETGLEVEHKDNMEAFLSYVLDEALPLAADGELNFALAIDNPRPGDSMDTNPSYHWIEHKEARTRYLDRRWKELLKARDEGLEGSAALYFQRDLVEENEYLYVGRRRIHVMIDYLTIPTPRSLTIPWLAGNLRLSNGPLSKIYSDKRYIAWMSELVDSDIFSAAEKEAIHNAVPWTRRVKAGVRTRFEGRRRKLEDILRTGRERLVLKPSVGLSGMDVYIGPKTRDEVWAEAVDKALAEGTWVAQEFIAPAPLAFQHGDNGWAPHNVVWGVFAFGDRLGGSFLRMSPLDGAGVVSAKLGAREGLYLEVPGE